MRGNQPRSPPDEGPLWVDTMARPWTCALWQDSGGDAPSPTLPCPSLAHVPHHRLHVGSPPHAAGRLPS